MFYSKRLKKIKTLKHCFFSRKNGFSKGLYKSLNCGRGSNDNKKNLQKNLNFVAKKMGVNYKILKIHNPWLIQNHLNNKSRKYYEIAIPEEGYY